MSSLPKIRTCVRLGSKTFTYQYQVGSPITPKTSSALFQTASKKCFSTESSKSAPLYELRMYRSLPKNFNALNAIFNERMDLRTKHSKLVGFWSAEIGDAIQQVVHLWEYESLWHRATVRQDIANDSDLLTNYMNHVMPLMEKMKNHIVVKAPGTDFDTDFVPHSKAVYVLQTVKCAKTGTVPKALHDDEKLVARLTSVIGPQNTEFRLWRYTDINSVTDSWTQRALEGKEEGKSLLMKPNPISQMQ